MVVVVVWPWFVFLCLCLCVWSTTRFLVVLVLYIHLVYNTTQTQLLRERERERERGGFHTMRSPTCETFMYVQLLFCQKNGTTEAYGWDKKIERSTIHFYTIN